jgi:hypothetical protein
MQLQRRALRASLVDIQGFEAPSLGGGGRELDTAALSDVREAAEK